MESSIWPSAQTAKGLKTQPKLASSDSSRPRMRNVLSPTRCALGLASFHHASWGFLQIKRVFPQRKRQVAHPRASRRSCTSLCSLLHHQTHVLGGGEGAVRFFLISPIRTAQTRLPARKERCREKRASRRTACQRLSWGPPLRGWLRHTLKKGPLPGSSITQSKRRSPITGLSHLLGEHPRATNTNYSLQLHMLPAPNSPLKCPLQKYIKSRAQGHKQIQGFKKSFRAQDPAVNRRFHHSFIPNLLGHAAF